MQDFFNGAERASDPDAIARAVLAHAEAHWGTNGWEQIAELWTLAAVTDTVLREELKTERDAIRHFKSLARRQASQSGRASG
jgi:hypothetical protein